MSNEFSGKIINALLLFQPKQLLTESDKTIQVIINPEALELPALYSLIFSCGDNTLFTFSTTISLHFF
jgi:hypothetical protein